MKSLRKLCCWVGKRTIRPSELSTDDSRHCSRIRRFWNTLGAGDLARRRLHDRRSRASRSSRTIRCGRSRSARSQRSIYRGGARATCNLRRVTTPLAILLALCPAIAGIARNSWTAGGADQYAYVSQADLWLQRDLTVPIPLAATAPWPEALLTFMPHGFRPAVVGTGIRPGDRARSAAADGRRENDRGHCAMFLVTPLTGALLVWMTFADRPPDRLRRAGPCGGMACRHEPGRARHARVADERRAGGGVLGGRHLLHARHARRGPRCSPALRRRRRFDSPEPGAVWRQFWCSGNSGQGRLTHASSSRRATGVGELQRFRAVAPADRRHDPRLSVHRVDQQRALWIAARVGIRIAVCAVLGLAYRSPTCERYGRWLVESQTPLAVVGIAVLARTGAKRSGRRANSSSAARAAGRERDCGVGALPHLHAVRCVVVPQIPAARMAGDVPRLGGCPRPRGAGHDTSRFGSSRARMLALVGAHNLYYASTHGAFPSGEGDHRYVSIAKIVEQATDPQP